MVNRWLAWRYLSFPYEAILSIDRVTDALRFVNIFLRKMEKRAIQASPVALAWIALFSIFLD
jgi:hypothetical protein